LPYGDTPPITYTGYDLTLQLTATVLLYATETQYQITFDYVSHGYEPYFYASYGPTVTVQPPTFNLQNSQWFIQAPYATIQVAIAYPGEP